MKFYILYKHTGSDLGRWEELEDGDNLEKLQLKLSVIHAEPSIDWSSVRIYPDEFSSRVENMPVRIAKTKGELANLRLKGFEYDLALPQAWLDDWCARHPAADRSYLMSCYVWLYDYYGGAAGRAFNIATFNQKEPAHKPNDPIIETPKVLEQQSS